MLFCDFLTDGWPLCFACSLFSSPGDAFFDPGGGIRSKLILVFPAHTPVYNTSEFWTSQHGSKYPVLTETHVREQGLDVLWLYNAA